MPSSPTSTRNIASSISTNLGISFGTTGGTNAVKHSNNDDFLFNVKLSKDLFIYRESDENFEAYMDFIDAPSVIISPKFEEHKNNDGSMSNKAEAIGTIDKWNIQSPFKFATSLLNAGNEKFDRAQYRWGSMS